MKFRLHKQKIGTDEEQRVTEDLRELLRARGLEAPQRLPAQERARLLARTNERLDAATSARALSWSWAARVAIPGVVAIIAFFTAVHYYQTPATRQEPAFLSLLSELPEDALDSLLAARAPAESTGVIVPAADLFALTREAAEEYLITLNRTPLVLEQLTEEEVVALVAELRHTPSVPL
jgi:hypothetical protein